MATGFSEIFEVRRAVGDLLALSELRELLVSRDRTHIAEILADALISTLRLDVIYLRVKHPNDTTIELLREANQHESNRGADIRKALAMWIGGSGTTSTIPYPTGDGTMQLFAVPVPPDGGLEILIAGSGRQDFPNVFERVLLQTATIQAVEALQQDRNRAPVADSSAGSLMIADLRRQKELLQTIVDHIPVMLNLIDRSGKIQWINREWERVLGWSLDEAQRLDILAECYPDPQEHEDVMQYLGAKESGWRDFWTRRKDGQRIDTAWVVVWLSDGSGIGIGQDITKRKEAEEKLRLMVEELRELSARLIHAQDNERRRLARELHETTAQDLVALKMNLARLSRADSGLNTDDQSLLKESVTLVEQSMADIRTLSYLLHPPFLDEVGLASALRWYISGFTERSGIQVDLDLPHDFERLAQETETTLFRIVQESLVNIHRHAESKTAVIRLCKRPKTLMLEVADQGRGMPRAALKGLRTGGGSIGVGIAGMRERISQIGGRLEIESSRRGTTVRVVLPLL